jgi:hypothetical protein
MMAMLEAVLRYLPLRLFKPRHDLFVFANPLPYSV